MQRSQGPQLCQLQGVRGEESKVRNLDFNDVIDIFARSKARSAVF